MVHILFLPISSLLIMLSSCFDLSYRKDFEVSQLQTKFEDEQSLGVQLQKNIKELQVTSQQKTKKTNKKESRPEIRHT